MLKTLNAFFAARSAPQIVVVCLLLVALTASFDHLIGSELSLSILYMVPVSLATWYVGCRAGFPIAALAAATWLWDEMTSGGTYRHAGAAVWNTTVRLAFFLIAADLLARLRSAFDHQTVLARQDVLTPVLNARAFKERCTILFQLAARHHHPLALGYLDVDEFKAVNDSLGHSAGDQVLQAVAATIGGVVRESDAVGRLGGDEFAVLLPETDACGARAAFTMLRERLAQLASENEWPIGFSVGVAVLTPPLPSPDHAIQLADHLMYRVKSAERNDLLIEEYGGRAGAREGADVSWDRGKGR